MPRVIDAVCFDVDGTLFSLRALALRLALRHPGALRVAWALSRVREGLRRESVVRPDLSAELDRRLAAQLGWPVERAVLARKRLLERQLPEALQKVGPLPGLRELLDGLVGRGVALAVLSDNPVEAKLAALGLADLPWAAKVDASALGALKPLPQAFEAVLDRLGVPRGRVMHVGDRHDADLDGAWAVGMRAALRRRRNARVLPGVSRGDDLGEPYPIGRTEDDAAVRARRAEAEGPFLLFFDTYAELAAKLLPLVEPDEPDEEDR